MLSSCTPKKLKEANTPINDSIQKYLKLGGDESIDIDLRNKYNGKALSLIDLNKNDTLIRFYLASLGFNYMRTKNEMQINRIGKIHFDKSTQAKDTINLSRYFRYKAAFYKNTFNNDSSFYYYLKAEKFYRKTNDKLGLGIVYQNKGALQFENYDYLGAELSSFKAYHIYKRIGNDERVYVVLNQLGRIYNGYQEFDKAKKCFNQALTIVENSTIRKKNYHKAILLSNLANVLECEGKFIIAAEKYCKIIDEIKDLKNYPILYSNILDNLALCKMYVKDYDNTLELFTKSLKIRKEIGDPSYIVSSLCHLSKYFNVFKKREMAEKYAMEALKIAYDSKNKIDYLFALREIKEVNQKYLSLYCKEYTVINDSLQIVERKSRNNFARIQLETHEITMQKETAIKHKWIIFSVSIVLILIVVLLLIITRQRNKQREMFLRQKQQKSNEDIYHLMLTQKEKEDEARQMEKSRIARELHDNIMNKLSSTRLSLSILALNTDHETIQKCLAQINGLSLIESEIRNVSHNLNQDEFQKRNSFVRMLKDFMNEQNDIGKTHFKLEIERSINWNIISSEIKMNLFRVIQEAINNINKHAKAKSASINFILDGSNICLSIVDDGIGFDVYLVTKGIGIENIKSRVDLLKGKLSINSTPGNTSINIAIPFYSTFP